MKCIEVVCFMNDQVIGQINYDEMLKSKRTSDSYPKFFSLVSPL